MNRQSRTSRKWRPLCLAYRLHRDLLLPGLCLAISVGTIIAPQAAIASETDQFAAHPYAPYVAEASQRFGIPELWIWAVVRAESRGNSRAVSSAGAMGLMQLMPGTWSTLTARHGLGSDPFDVRANILGGAAYLRAMWDRYGDVGLMLAAYNAGPGRADDYAAGRRGLPAETINYVAQIVPGLGISSVAAPAAMPPAITMSWRQSALFAPRDVDGGDRADSATPEQPEDASGAIPVRSLRRADRAPHALFVSLSSRNP